MNARKLMVVVFGLCVLPGLVYAGAVSPSGAEDVGWQADMAKAPDSTVQAMVAGQPDLRPEVASPDGLQSPAEGIGDGAVLGTPAQVATLCVAPGGAGGCYGSLQEAIAAAATDDIIEVAGGTYVETGQIVINKNLTIVGDPDDKPVVKPAQDTGSSGDPRGWWLVQAGCNLTLQNMILDGDSPTRKVHQGIRTLGTGTVDNCDFRNIIYPTYYGLAVVFMGGNGTVTNCTFENIGRIGMMAYGSGVTDALFNGNTYTGKGAVDSLDYGIELGGGAVATITNNTITDCTAVASSDGSTSAAILITTYYGAGTAGTVLGNVLTGNTTGIAAGYGSSDTSVVVAHYNDLSGNDAEGLDNTSSTLTVDAEKNWWATTDLTVIAGMVGGLVDYDPPLLTDKIRMAFSGNRLVDLQQNDGGWDWPLDDGDPNNASPLNTVGPIAKGLAMAYRATSDPDMLDALQDAGTLLLAKTNNFSPCDGYLAAELDSVFGGTTYVDHVTANFYDPLAAGTYDRNGAGPLYDTAGYVNLVRTSRASQGIANLAAWDVGMGLVAAVACGVTDPDLQDWIDGVEAEVNELDGSADYDVIGLAGAVYGLAVADDWDFDPTAGEHAAAGDLLDLADILADYQITESGGFTWSSDYVIAYDYNETIQETAYAVLALKEVGGYDSAIAAAAAYMLSVQLPTGGWENYVGSTSGENNEVTGEGIWGVSAAGNVLELLVESDSLYVQPTETITIDMDVRDLLQPINGCQALMAYDSTYLTAGDVAAGGGLWDQVIYEVFRNTPGELDTAIGVDAAGAGGVSTEADATVAVITFTAGDEGTTDLVFRTDPNLGYATMLTDINGEAVYPNKIDSQTIVIDGTDPSVDSFSVAPLCTKTSTTVTFTVSDDNAGVDYVDVYVDDGMVTHDVTSPYVLDMSGYATETCHNVKIRVADKSGNEADSADASVCVDKTAPTISNIVAEQGTGNSVLCSEVAVQGIVDIYVDVTDAGCADLVVPPTVDVAGIGAAAYQDVSGDTYHYQVTVVAGTANGAHQITVDAEDDLGNASSDTSASICVDKNQVTGQIELESFVGTQRVVTFVATGGASSKSWTFNVSGFAGSVASYTLTQVPAGTNGLSAKTAWSLRNKLAVTLDGDNQATGVNFTGGEKLLGGDLNDSNFVNIQDYSILAWTYMSPTDLRADIDGNGTVGIGDYSILQSNYFQAGEAE